MALISKEFIDNIYQVIEGFGQVPNKMFSVTDDKQSIAVREGGKCRQIDRIFLLFIFCCFSKVANALQMEKNVKLFPILKLNLESTGAKWDRFGGESSSSTTK